MQAVKAHQKGGRRGGSQSASAVAPPAPPVPPAKPPVKLSTRAKPKPAAAALVKERPPPKEKKGPPAGAGYSAAAAIAAGGEEGEEYEEYEDEADEELEQEEAPMVGASAASRRPPSELNERAERDDYHRFRSGGGENPFKAMQLALEAAPLGLRVLGMPSTDDWPDNDEPYADLPTPSLAPPARLGESLPKFSLTAKLGADTGAPTNPVFESALRSSLDGAVDAASVSVENAADDLALLEKRRYASRQELALREAARQRELAAARVQAGYRGMHSRHVLGGKGKSRTWLFAKDYTRSFDTSGRNHARFVIRDNEKLQIVNVEGAGRLLLTATHELTGEAKVTSAVVYDSLLAAVGFTAPTRGANSSLWSGGGEYEYELAIEPLDGFPNAQVRDLPISPHPHLPRPSLT